MQDDESSTTTATKRSSWNKGKLIGPKPPLRPKHVWSIRTKLQLEGRTRNLAMFNLAIDSKPRGCDVVSLKVEDVAPLGYAVDRAMVRQKKTGQPRQVRIDRADPRGDRRLHQALWQEAEWAYLGHKDIWHTVRYTELSPVRFRGLWRD
jgi:hypothetical protein